MLIDLFFDYFKRNKKKNKNIILNFNKYNFGITIYLILYIIR